MVPSPAPAPHIIAPHCIACCYLSRSSMDRTVHGITSSCMSPCASRTSSLIIIPSLDITRFHSISLAIITNEGVHWMHFYAALRALTSLSACQDWLEAARSPRLDELLSSFVAVFG